jgi:glycosyltransferase involved in cell wall biosynthesis
MNLLVVSSWFPFPPDNGAKTRAYNLLVQLAQRHDVSLLSFVEAGEGDGVQALKTICREVQTVTGNPFKPQEPLGVRTLFSRMPRSFAETYSARMQALVDAAVPQNNAAVALELGSALYLAKHRSLPRVFDEAETTVVRDQYRFQPWGLTRFRHGLTWWKFAHFLRQVAGRFERTTVVSDIEFDHLREIRCVPAAIRVVPNGVARDALSQRNTPRPGRLIYPGSITYSANLDAVRHFINDIAPLVRAVRSDASLIVTGATGEIDLEPLIKSGAVTFTGRIDDVSHVIGQSSVCIVPLRIGGGTRIKILQAMALGTPVVSTSKGAEGLAVTPEHDILIADTPQAFAQQVLRLLNDFVLRARLSANGRRLIERLYTWERIGAQFEEVLDEACETHRGNPIVRSVARSSRNAARA